MNRKKKIIYITGIFVILVAIIGFTYAYIGTRILGNSNSKNMSFTSKKVSVTYKEISNTSSGETISPGYQYLKIFTATNTGNVEVKYHIYLDEVENDFIRVQDITYTLYRKSGNNTITSSNLSSAEVIASGTFPIINQYIKTDEVLTKPNDVYTYALKINYNTSTESQDSDSGHVFGFKVQLHTNKDETYGENTLAYNVIKNAIGVTDTQEKAGTAKYRPTPTTALVTAISSSTEADLSQTIDDYGKTFYFRGNVKNNYVNFANKCWRIVRILGDGSVKLVLEDKDVTCDSSSYTGNFVIGYGNFGYTEYARGSLTASDGVTNPSTKYIKNYLNGNDSSMAKAFSTFQNTFTSTQISKLKSGNWCFSDKAYIDSTTNPTELSTQEVLDYIVKNTGTGFDYDSQARIVGKTKTATLKCNGTILEEFSDNTVMYVAALTADEIVYAGAKVSSSNKNYWLINKYHASSKFYFWTLSPNMYYNNKDYAYRVHYYGFLDPDLSVSGTSGRFRPSIQLVSGITVSKGIGTSTSPYVIE